MFWEKYRHRAFRQDGVGKTTLHHHFERCPVPDKQQICACGLRGAQKPARRLDHEVELVPRVLVGHHLHRLGEVPRAESKFRCVLGAENRTTMRWKRMFSARSERPICCACSMPTADKLRWPARSP